MGYEEKKKEVEEYDDPWDVPEFNIEEIKWSGKHKNLLYLANEHWEKSMKLKFSFFKIKLEININVVWIKVKINVYNFPVFHDMLSNSISTNLVTQFVTVTYSLTFWYLDII